MIKNFACKETEKIFRRQLSRRLPHLIQSTALKKLWMLNAATSLVDLKIPPANRLEKLAGFNQNEYSLRINDQWRICFKWLKQDAYQVKIIDYH